MSHFAEVKDGIVVTVIVADQEYADTLEGTWIQTSYNTHGNVHHGQDEQPDGGVALRKNYAGSGYLYDSTADAFYLPQPYPSWTLNKTSFLWEAPSEMPNDDKMYTWDEDATDWALTSYGD